MLLRRVIEHVKTQNWTAVALDFIIVVVGVFIGIQVANWNDIQAEKRLGKEYTERLISDLERDLEWKRVTFAYYESVLLSAEKTMELLSVDVSDDEALVINAYRATEYSYLAPARATWDEVVSTGKSDLLPRLAAENELSGYFSHDYGYDPTQRVLDSPYRQRVRRLLPHALQKNIRELCSDVLDDINTTIGLMENCELSVPQSVIENGGDLLRADPAVIADLRYHFSTINMVRSNYEGDIVFLERVIDALSGDQNNDKGAR